MNDVGVTGSQLIDDHGRVIRKLRVSLLDACNFRCFYCMPKSAKFASASTYLSPSALFEVCEQLIERGIEQIRITGGEPTLRAEFREIMAGIGRLPLKKFGITTNGFSIESHLSFLKDVGCNHINISLDSLNEANFNKITRSSSFKKTLSAILASKKMGFEVKVNTVLMAGVNDHEIYDFMNFSSDHDIEVRFLELMKIGQVFQSQSDYFISAADAIRSLSKKSELIAEGVEFDSTSFNFKTEKGARIGFIASESKPFCGSCSRLRLTYDGHLRACLMSEAGLDLKGLGSNDLSQALSDVIGMKPTERLFSVEQDMNKIGG